VRGNRGIPAMLRLLTVPVVLLAIAVVVFVVAVIVIVGVEGGGWSAVFGIGFGIALVLGVVSGIRTEVQKARRRSGS
jgi:hypothetical protein